MARFHKIVEYHSEFYNQSNETEQWLRLSDGCFRNCWNCYAPTKKVHYKIPEIIRNKVVIMDMNFLWAYPNPAETLKFLGNRIVNKKCVKYDFCSGLDYTLLTPEICRILFYHRFGRFNNKRNFTKAPRIAWDRSVKEQKIMKGALKELKRAGFTMRNIQVFILANGKIPFDECALKLDLMKVWNVQVADCWYDNQKRGSVEPRYWSYDECKAFGKLCRTHNKLVNFGIDPELADLNMPGAI